MVNRALTFFLCLVFLCTNISNAQHIVVQDTLTSSYHEGQDLKVVLDLTVSSLDDNPRESLKFSRNGLEVAQFLNHIEYQIIFHTLAGQALYNLNIYDEALASYFDATKLAEQSDYPQLLARIQYNMSNIYDIYAMHDKSLYYDFQAAENIKKSNDPLLESNINYNIGRDYLYQGSLTYAGNYLSKSLSQKKAIDDVVGMGRVYYLMNILNSELGELEKSKDLQLKARRIFEKTESRRDLIKIYYDDIAEFLSANQYSGIKDLLDSCITIAEDLNDDHLRMRNEQFLYLYYEEIGEIDRALQAHLNYSGLKNSLFFEDRGDKIAEMEVKHAAAVQERENRELREKILEDRVERNLIIWLFVIVIILGFMIMLFYRYKSKEKRQRELEAMNQKLEKNVEDRTKELRDEVTLRARISEELDVARLRAEESERLKSAFLQNLSHEVRTPMNAIVGFSGIINDENIPTEEREGYVKLIKDNGERLLRIIEDTIDLSHLTSHQLTFDVKETSLESILTECRDYMILDSEQQKKNLELDYVDPTNYRGVKFTSDGMRIKQVIEHIINNAIKFTEVGYVKLDVDCDSEDIRFIVSDTGIGIKLEQQKKIFELFTQADGTSTRVHGGIGIGLFMAKEIIKILKGEVNITSTPGRGTEVVISVPRSYYAAGYVDNEVNEEAITKVQWSDKHILIYDNKDLNYQLMETMLHSTGIRVSRAVDESSLIEYLSNGSMPDAVLMDGDFVSTTGGYSLIEEIRNKEIKIPIITRTEEYKIQLRTSILNAGGDGFLFEPISKEKTIKYFMKYFN
jgi:signal transduction histidine kinase